MSSEKIIALVELERFVAKAKADPKIHEHRGYVANTAILDEIRSDFDQWMRDTRSRPNPNYAEMDRTISLTLNLAAQFPETYRQFLGEVVHGYPWEMQGLFSLHTFLMLLRDDHDYCVDLTAELPVIVHDDPKENVRGLSPKGYVQAIEKVFALAID